MSKYLTVGTLIAIILNPLFAVVDYMTVGETWMQFLLIRIFVTAILIFVFFNKDMMKNNPIQAGVIILSSVVIQDAWFYSFTPRETFTQVSLAYLADFVGAGMVLLWSPVIAVVFLAGFIAVNVLFFSLNSTRFRLEAIDIMDTQLRIHSQFRISCDSIAFYNDQTIAIGVGLCSGASMVD